MNSNDGINNYHNNSINSNTNNNVINDKFLLVSSNDVWNERREGRRKLLFLIQNFKKLISNEFLIENFNYFIHFIFLNNNNNNGSNSSSDINGSSSNNNNDKSKFNEQELLLFQFISLFELKLNFYFNLKEQLIKIQQLKQQQEQQDNNNNEVDGEEEKYLKEQVNENLNFFKQLCKFYFLFLIHFFFFILNNKNFNKMNELKS
jgi:hypothetical protein